MSVFVCLRVSSQLSKDERSKTITLTDIEEQEEKEEEKEKSLRRSCVSQTCVLDHDRRSFFHDHDDDGAHDISLPAFPIHLEIFLFFRSVPSFAFIAGIFLSPGNGSGSALAHLPFFARPASDPAHEKEMRSSGPRASSQSNPLRLSFIESLAQTMTRNQAGERRAGGRGGAVRDVRVSFHQIAQLSLAHAVSKSSLQSHGED